MQNSNLSNMRFKQLVEVIRDVMPLLAVGLLILVYAISGLVAGKFLGSPTLLGRMEHGAAIGYATGFAIQATRGLLVFFRQMNPVRPTLGYSGEVIAFLMGGLSIYEIATLSTASGMGYPVAFSMGVLMLAGIGVEVFLLAELRFYTEIELMESGRWEQAEQLYIKRAKLRERMKLLKQGMGMNDTPRPSKPITNTLEAKPGITIEASPKPVVHEVAPIPFSVNGNGKHIAGTVADH
jgi:hypothetical protein